MPRQNYLSKESFVAATAQQARESLLSIPAFVSSVSLLADNRMIESIRFSYEDVMTKVLYHIDVSVLALNDQYTRISLHGTYSNGQAFTNHTDIALVLHDFESAIEAAIKGDASLYKPHQPRLSHTKKFVLFASTLTTSIGFFFLKRKLS